MKIIIGNETYTKIKNLSFAPEIDLTCESLPINEFYADIYTYDDIGYGKTASLYDDRNKLWAQYWVIEAYETGNGIVRLKAQSKIALLERRTLPPVMYDDEPINSVLGTIFATMGYNAYSLHSSFSGETFTGYCPEQTARDRLLWVITCIGAYVKTFFNSKVEILPLNLPDEDTGQYATNPATIPMRETFWRPQISYKDYVTESTAKYYSYTEGEPETGESYVKIGDDIYIQTEDDLTIQNPDAPSSAPEKVAKIGDGNTLINFSNVDLIMSRLDWVYTFTEEVELDCINNRSYCPGETVYAYLDETHMILGIIESCDFSFGLQARSKMKIKWLEDIDTGKLTIIRYATDLKLQIGKEEYRLPLNRTYNTRNPYLDVPIDVHRYVFRPLTPTASGKATSSGTTIRVNYNIALDRHEQKNTLKVVSVDSFTLVTENNVRIGVIA